tara:strand:- start:194 stop:373 length:180 start_codon:yes stop_codon:yes gene_type:complete
MAKKDTTTEIQTKGWSTMTLRISKELKDALREDAKFHMRPIGMHLSYIVQNYLLIGRER